MGLFKSKSIVEKHEEEFKTKKMENRNIFHELNIRGTDPELLRTEVLELVEDLGYDISINKLTKFEDAEFDKIFRGGRLKPLRAVLSAEKEVQTDSMFPFLWKIVAILGMLSFLAFFIPQSFFDSFNISVNSYYFIISSLILFGSAVILFLTKKVDYLNIWFKASGIYNIQNDNTDLRIILSADTTSNEKKVIKKIDDEVAEIFRVISKKYVKKKQKKGVILSIPKSEKNADISIIKNINTINNDIKNLDVRLARGEISESVYNEIKENFIERKHKLETILDLIKV